MNKYIGRLKEDIWALSSLSVIVITILVGLFAQWLVPNDPNQVVLANKYMGFCLSHPLGTDHLGRCVLSRLIYGVRSTVFLALMTMMATIFVGAFWGLVAGTFRGWVDELIMRICDIMLSFPSQVMILAIVGMLGVGIENVIIANIAVKWAWYTRMIRSVVDKYASKNYVLFARATGAGRWFVLRKHILPNAVPEITILASLDAGWVILNLSALSFLGLGVQPPTPEWGVMLSEAQKVLLVHPEQMFIPGLAIIVLVVAFNLLGDSLRDLLEAKGRKA